MGCPYGELQGVAVGVSLWGALGCGVWDVAMGRPWGSPAHISPQDGTLALGAPGGYYFRGECGPNHCDTAVTVGGSGGKWGTVGENGCQWGTMGDSGGRWGTMGDTMGVNGGQWVPQWGTMGDGGGHSGGQWTSVGVSG